MGGSIGHYFPGRFAGLDDIAKAISDSWRTGAQVGTFSFHRDRRCPLTLHRGLLLRMASPIFIEDDCVPLFVYTNIDQCFATIETWGANVVEHGVPFDDPFGSEAVQVVCQGSSRLLSFVEDEADVDLIRRTQDALTLSAPNPELNRPIAEPISPVFDGIVLAEVLCLVPESLQLNEVVVFSLTRDESFKIGAQLF